MVTITEQSNKFELIYPLSSKDGGVANSQLPFALRLDAKEIAFFAAYFMNVGAVRDPNTHFVDLNWKAKITENGRAPSTLIGGIS